MMEKVICNACPILCKIRCGKKGACSRYENKNGKLCRTAPIVLIQKTDQPEFLGESEQGTREILHAGNTFITGVGAKTTYPDFKPAPFIIGSQVQGVDVVTVVTEGIFSFGAVKVKIDTDRHLGPEQAAIYYGGQQVGHVTTKEYGSQMLAIGGVNYLANGDKKVGKQACHTMVELCNKQPQNYEIEGGVSITIQAGKAPIINGIPEKRMRVGCGSATIGIFAQQWQGLCDEVIVVDDHITGVLSEHQAGKILGMSPTGIKIRGRKSTPGRYFHVANPGSRWGGTDITDPLNIIKNIDEELAYPGLRLLFVSTTGEDYAYFVLDELLLPQPAEIPAALQIITDRIGENCEPSICSVLFMAGAGGSLRAGVTENPIQLTNAIKKGDVNVTCGGIPTYIWPGGGITFMVDVSKMPDDSFGAVPTPAIVAPIEFSMRQDVFQKLGGHMDALISFDDFMRENREDIQMIAWQEDTPWPAAPSTSKLPN